MKRVMGILLGVCLFGLISVLSLNAAEKEREIIRLPLSNVSPKVDGIFDKKSYEDAIVLGGEFPSWGKSPRPGSPTVYLKRTEYRLFVLYDNPLRKGEMPTLHGAIPDNAGICMGNAVELFFKPNLPPGEIVHYIQFAGNARGCIYDALNRPSVGVKYVKEFTKPWLFGNLVENGHWYSEISTTFKDVNISSTANGDFFDFDCGRDGGHGPQGVHSYTKTFIGIGGKDKGVKIIFDTEAPIVQWLSFGEFEKNHFNPKLRLKSTDLGAGKYKVSLLLESDKLEKDKTREKFFQKEFEVDLGKDDSKDITVDFPLKDKSKGIVHYRITGKDGKVIFYHKFPYQSGNDNYPYFPTEKPEPMTVKVQMAPSYGKIEVATDIIYYQGDKKDLGVKVEIKDKNNKVIGKTLLDKFQLDYASGIIDIGKIEPGDYQVDFKLINLKTGKETGVSKTEKITRKIHEWENNKLGISDVPPPPWTPLEVTSEGMLWWSKPVVKVWGREYTFTGLGLPKTIDTLQENPARSEKMEDALSGPMTIKVVSDGKELAWNNEKSEIVSHNKMEAVIKGSGEVDGLKAEVKGTLDFDGFYKIHLKLEPTGEKSFDSIIFEIPMSTEQARLFHAVGECMRTNKTHADLAGLKDGVIWDSKSTAQNAIISGNFLPCTYLGSEDRGVAWMCDNDKSWQITFEKPCLDVYRQGEKTYFRVHLLNKKGKLAKPIDTVFGVQAVPVRPRLAGGSWKEEPFYGWGYFDKPLIYDKCFEGIKKPGDLAPKAWYTKPEYRKKNLWWRYGCFSSDRINEKDPKYGQFVKDFGGEWYCDSMGGKYQNKAHQDFELWAWKQWHDVASMDGIYFDNTYPSPSINLMNGKAWIDENNKLRGGYAVMGKREQLKRLRTMLTGFGPAPVMRAHTTDTPIPGYLGFCDQWMDGECGGYPTKKLDATELDFVDRWYNKTGLANLRLTLGPQWGCHPRYLYSWGPDATYTVLGMFDLENGYRSMGREPYHKFGRFEKDVKHIPYWTKNFPAEITKGGPDIMLTAWTRPKQARILICNMSEGNRQVDLKVNLAELGLSNKAIALDEREGSQIKMENGIIKDLPVYRHNYETLIISEPGVHQPLSADLGKKLEPPKSEWLPNLCDDFKTLDEKKWQKYISPNIDKATGRHAKNLDPLCVRKGYLRFRTGSSICDWISMPFKQDNCSVQVKMIEPLGSPHYVKTYHGPFGSKLELEWPDGSTAGIRAWERLAKGKEKLVCYGRNDKGKNVFNKLEGAWARTLWVKIDLTPEQIEYYSSTDGEKWNLLTSFARKKYFKGAPNLIRLGHGNDKDSYMESHCVDSYFDDLITAKLPKNTK